MLRLTPDLTIIYNYQFNIILKYIKLLIFFKIVSLFLCSCLITNIHYKVEFLMFTLLK